MLPPFEYIRPNTLEEAVSRLAELESTRILAGGTDVLVQMRAGSSNPGALVDIKKLDALKGFEFSPEKGLVIGALATHSELANSKLIQEKYAILFDGVSRVGSVQIRNRATVGGNLCSALPSADSAGPLLALNAVLEIYGPEGKREVPLDQFYLGTKKTVLKKGEILTRIFIPAYGKNSGGAYIKFTRRKAMDLALLGVSVFLETEEDQKTCKGARIALTTAAPTPIRAYQAEAVLKGQVLDQELFSQAAAAVLNEAKPRSSWRAPEEFRRRLIKHLVPRAGMLAWERLKKPVLD
ncbi:FAD binding domain-containing protein [Candidatus Formimonas warabiya]|uniref:FAD-binding PCMH-type domain-containing protein n=1 Tax=Formimonas warabiya TaxID=1761012 RepID=A0A3G1KXR4_FORW1|nr:FAD binding domain-containing protein [Candidatus Formimonas warabiya]ATW27159.1 hypothetical protein DCMF_22570 [Candidatus Formimonas warabiya]